MKDKIIEATIQQILKFGFRKFTIDDVTSQLGISKKTVYKYFDSKRSLIAAAVDQYMALDRAKHAEVMASSDNFQERFMNLLTSDTHAMIPTWLLAELQQYFPDLWEHCAACDQVMRDENMQVYAQGIARGEIRADIHPALIDLIVERAFDGIFDYRFLTRYDLTLNQALNQLKSLILYGISNENRHGKEQDI